MRRIENTNIHTVHVAESFERRLPRIARRRRQNEHAPHLFPLRLRPLQKIRKQGEREILERTRPSVKHFRHGKCFAHTDDRHDFLFGKCPLIRQAHKFRQFFFRNIGKETPQYKDRRFLIGKIFYRVIGNERRGNFLRHIQPAVLRQSAQQSFRRRDGLAAPRTHILHRTPPLMKTFLVNYIVTQRRRKQKRRPFAFRQTKRTGAMHYIGSRFFDKSCARNPRSAYRSSRRMTNKMPLAR